MMDPGRAERKRMKITSIIVILAAVVGAGSAAGQAGECADVRVNATKTWTTSPATKLRSKGSRARKADAHGGKGDSQEGGKGGSQEGDVEGHDNLGLGGHKHDVLLYLQGHLQKSDCALWDITITSLRLKHKGDLWLENTMSQHDVSSVTENADGTTSVRLQARTSSDRDGLKLSAELNRSITIQGSVRSCESDGEVLSINESLTALVGTELNTKYGKTGSARLHLHVYDVACQEVGSSEPIWLDADFDFETLGELVVPDVLPVIEGKPQPGERAVLEIGNHECGVGNFSGVVRCSYVASLDAARYEFLSCDDGSPAGARLPGNAVSLRVNPEAPGCPGMRTTVSVGLLACGVGAVVNPLLP